MNKITPQQLQAMPAVRRFRLFTQWLGNQPEGGQYEFSSIDDCALCQFSRQILQPNSFDYLSAGAANISLGTQDGDLLDVLIIPVRDYSLNRNNFGAAYHGLAPLAGLPRRKELGALSRFLSRFIKHRRPLAA